MRIKKIKIGTRFGDWTVIGEQFSDTRQTKVPCQCKCGKHKNVSRGHLVSKKTKGCGCEGHKLVANLSRGKVSRNAKSANHIAKKQLYNSYKHSAKIRNLSFNLSAEEFCSFLDKSCHYCGTVLSNTKKVKKRGSFSYNGIDRIDNSIGYELSNCVPCCKRCNIIKNDMDGSSFIEHIQKIIKQCKTIHSFSEKKMLSYHDRALTIAKQSPDEETKVGALLINPITGAVMAEGYNGFMRGAPDHLLPKTRPDKYQYIIHAETNLICNATYSGIKTEGCVLYCTLSPCTKCIRMLYQAGITTFYFKDKYRDFDESSAMEDVVIECKKIYDFYHMTVKPAG